MDNFMTFSAAVQCFEGGDNGDSGQPSAAGTRDTCD